MKINNFHYLKCNFPGINRLWSAVCQVSKHFFASVRLSQVCSPYSAQLTCYSFVITWISRLFENIYTNLIISWEWWLQSLWSIDMLNVEHESTKIWWDTWIIIIKLRVERHKCFIQLVKVTIGVNLFPRFIYFELLYTNFLDGVFHITIWSAAQILRWANIISILCRLLQLMLLIQIR